MIPVFLMLTSAASFFLPNAGSQQAARTEKPTWALKFADYAEERGFIGKPAAPQPASKRQKMFRSAIRQAAAKGPNFAGHFTVAEWGCGAGCASFVIVDAINGKTFDPPFKTVAMPLVEGGRLYQGVVYHLNSRLLIVDGCPDEDDAKCGTYYYEWKDGQLQLLPFDPQPIPK